jgi:hypothetical protein
LRVVPFIRSLTVSGNIGRILSCTFKCKRMEGVKTGGEEKGEIRRYENRIRRRDDGGDSVSGGIIIPFALS